MERMIVQRGTAHVINDCCSVIAGYWSLSNNNRYARHFEKKQMFRRLTGNISCIPVYYLIGISMPQELYSVT